MSAEILVGFAVGAGEPVAVPLGHLAVTGMTQAAGKTTALEALVRRSGKTALAFITKRGESSFQDARTIRPYFRDRADWQFVTSIIDATLQEKNKFLRPWIIRTCRTTRTLTDVQSAVRAAMEKARGQDQGAYTQIDAYLDLIIPEIKRARLAETLDLREGRLNVMDISDATTPMQMLFVQSALDVINELCRDTIVVIPEAWEFIPEGAGSPVKASAIALARKGAGIGNYIWVDSQDMAGVDKTILRACSVWMIGVQREANELKRALANVPASMKKPKAGDLATLEKGQFYVCWARNCTKTYVWPAWMKEQLARDYARGDGKITRETGSAIADRFYREKEEEVTPQEAQALRDENTSLSAKIADLTTRLSNALDEIENMKRRQTIREEFPAPREAPPAPLAAIPIDEDALFERLKQRFVASAPGILEVVAIKPEMKIKVERRTMQLDGDSLKGRVARLIAEGFVDQGRKQAAIRAEIARRQGSEPNFGSLSKIMAEIVRDGFLVREADDTYVPVAGMKVNIIET